MSDLIIGAGEVGAAVAKVLGCDLVDITHQNRHVDQLHICFPHDDHFDGEIARYRTLFDPQLVVIHSTVPVGTTRRHGAVHSPVRGRHPHLTESLTTFVKFFAGHGACLAANRWPGPVEVIDNPDETEAGKLWELVQYGLQIAVEKEIHGWCEQASLQPEVVYRRFAETYNAGYTALDAPRFVRPVLDHIPGRIGGHCIIQNAPLVDHRLARLLVDLDGQW